MVIKIIGLVIKKPLEFRLWSIHYTYNRGKYYRIVPQNNKP